MFQKKLSKKWVLDSYEYHLQVANALRLPIETVDWYVYVKYLGEIGNNNSNSSQWMYCCDHERYDTITWIMFHILSITKKTTMGSFAIFLLSCVLAQVEFKQYTATFVCASSILMATAHSVAFVFANHCEPSYQPRVLGTVKENTKLINAYKAKISHIVFIFKKLNLQPIVIDQLLEYVLSGDPTSLFSWGTYKIRK